MNETEHKIAALALLLQSDTQARLAARYSQAQADAEVAQIVPGRKYTKIDIGGAGKLMVENATGNVYGIKAYGQVHKGHQYGTLDTTSEWYWGEFYPRKRTDQDAPAGEYATSAPTLVTGKTAPDVQVGDGFTRVIGSDRDPWTVVAVSESGKTVTVQADKCELDPTWKADARPGGFSRVVVNQDSQKWIITPDTDGPCKVIRLTVKGHYQDKGETPFHHQGRNPGRKFYDYNF